MSMHTYDHISRVCPIQDNIVSMSANMVLTTRHGKLLGKYSGPGWNYLDIVFATGKNIKARLCLKKHVIRMIDLSETGMSLSRRMILVPWSFWRCATAVVLVFGPTRDALVKIFDQKFLSKRYG